MRSADRLNACALIFDEQSPEATLEQFVLFWPRQAAGRRARPSKSSAAEAASSEGHYRRRALHFGLPMP